MNEILGSMNDRNWMVENKSSMNLERKKLIQRKKNYQKKKLNLHSQIVTHNVAICGLQQVIVKSLDHHIKWTNK